MPEINLSLNPNDPLVQHAFRGSSFAVVRLEELNEIANLKADAVACYRPANSQELFAIERIALCQQAILRGYRLESGLFTVALNCAIEESGRAFRPMGEDMIGDGDIEITRAQTRNYAAGEGVRQMSTESDVWALLIRYQVNADRQYRRAIEDFDRLKRLRPEMPTQSIDPKPAPIDDLASFTELGRSYLNHRRPVAPEPPAASPAPIATPSPDFTPTAHIRRSAAPETSRLKVVPITSFFPRPASNPRPPATPRPRHPGAHCRPAPKPAAPRHGSIHDSASQRDKISSITSTGQIDIPAW